MAELIGIAVAIWLWLTTATAALVCAALTPPLAIAIAAIWPGAFTFNETKSNNMTRGFYQGRETLPRRRSLLLLWLLPSLVFGHVATSSVIADSFAETLVAVAPTALLALAALAAMLLLDRDVRKPLIATCYGVILLLWGAGTLLTIQIISNAGASLPLTTGPAS